MPFQDGVQVRADFLVFEVAGHSCAVSSDCVQEVVFLPALTRSPGQPSVLEGFLDLRGRAVPVVRLHRLFDLPSAMPGLHTPLVVARIGDETVALLVDRVLEIASVPACSLQPLSETDSFNGCAEAQFPVDGRTVVVFGARRLLLEKEKQCIAELRARTQSALDELRDRTA